MEGGEVTEEIEETPGSPPVEHDTGKAGTRKARKGLIP